MVETGNTENNAIIIDGSHIKVHQDATRLGLGAEEQVFGKTKGGRNSKISAAVNGNGKAIKLLLVKGNEHGCNFFYGVKLAVNERKSYPFVWN